MTTAETIAAQRIAATHLGICRRCGRTFRTSSPKVAVTCVTCFLDAEGLKIVAKKIDGVLVLDAVKRRERRIER